MRAMIVGVLMPPAAQFLDLATFGSVSLGIFIGLVGGLSNAIAIRAI